MVGSIALRRTLAEFSPGSPEAPSVGCDYAKESQKADAVQEDKEKGKHILASFLFAYTCTPEEIGAHEGEELVQDVEQHRNCQEHERHRLQVPCQVWRCALFLEPLTERSGHDHGTPNAEYSRPPNKVVGESRQVVLLVWASCIADQQKHWADQPCTAEGTNCGRE